MQLKNKVDVLARFTEIALELGVPPAKGATAGKQCFDSMARMAEKHAKESDRDRRKCQLDVLPRPAPDVALVDWLNALPENARDAAIMNNVRPYVPLYENDLDAAPEVVDPVSPKGMRPLPPYTPSPEYAAQTKGLRELTDALNASMNFPETNVVAEGSFSGQILSVADGVVTQKVNRSGETVNHDASKLSVPVKVGDVVEVQYRDGQGEVSGVGQAVAVGR